MGLGSMGGGSQMLFGGSSGQDFLQKATWILGASFLILSIGTALLRTNLEQTSRYVTGTSLPAAPQQAPANLPSDKQPGAPAQQPVEQPAQNSENTAPAA